MAVPSTAGLSTPTGDTPLFVAVGAAEEGDGVGGLGMGVAFEAGPGAALGVPEVALEAVGLVGVGRQHPTEENVPVSLAGVLEEALAQVHVVPADAFGDGALRTDALQEIDAGTAGRDRPGDVRLGQANRGLDAGSWRKAGEKRRLRRIGFARFKPRPSRRPHFRGSSVARFGRNCELRIVNCEFRGLPFRDGLPEKRSRTRRAFSSHPFTQMNCFSPATTSTRSDDFSMTSAIGL